MNFHFFFISILAFYLIATLFYLLRLIIGKKILGAIGLRFTLLAAALQTLVLIAHFILTKEAWFSSYLEYFQISAWLLAVIFIILCFTKKFYAGGPLFISLIVVFCLLSLAYGNPQDINANMRGHSYLYFHLTSTFLSLSIFSLGLISAILFLLLERQIKSKRFEGWLSKLPPLEVIEEIHYKSLYTAFVIFTFSIITGAGFEKVKTGHYINNDFKQILSIACWIFFMLFLNLRVRRGWYGHKGVLLSLVGFAGIVLLFFVGLS